LASSIIVGIAGGSASGKTAVVHRLVEMLGASCVLVISHDAYYRDLSHLPLERRGETNVDHPGSLETGLLVDHLSDLRNGRSVEIPVYDYVTQTRGQSGLLVDPAPVTLVEGLFTLFDDDLRAMMDLRAWIDVSADERLRRRIVRDVRERGRVPSDVERLHAQRVQPMHERFVEPTRMHADIVIEGGGENLPGICDLADRVRALLQV
jgi:uridine kinase